MNDCEDMSCLKQNRYYSNGSNGKIYGILPVAFHSVPIDCEMCHV